MIKFITFLFFYIMIETDGKIKNKKCKEENYGNSHFYHLPCCFGAQNIISITIHKKRFSKQVDELQKQLDEKKEESELVMREMLSNITHDLKTPLTAIRGYAQGILDGVAATPDRMNKYISTIRNKADDWQIW